MSISEQINRINTNISDAYSVSLEKGATLPSVQNSANLAAAIESIPQSDTGISDFSFSPILSLKPDTYVLHTNGEERSAANINTFSTTDFFEVSERMKIKLTDFTKHGANASGICFYDGDKVFISGKQYANDVSEMTFDVPAGARYCRFTISTVKSGKFKCYLGNFAEAINAAAAGPALSFYSIESVTNYRISRYIKWADGLQAYVSNVSFCSTDYIPVSGMKQVLLKKVKATSYGGDKSGIAFYNSHMRFISGIEYPNDGSNDYTCSLPAGACYIRFTFRQGYIGRGIMLTEEQYSAALAFKNRIRTPLTGKLLYVNGDSITAGYNVQTSENYDTAFAEAIGKPLNYSNLTAYRNQCDVINRAVNHEPFARIIVHGEEKNGFLSNSARYGDIPKGVDYITLLFGWNDFYWGRISEKEKWLKKTYGTDIWFPENTSQIGTDGYTTQEQYDAVMNYSATIDGVTYTGDRYYLKKFLGTINDTTSWTWYGAWNYALKNLKDRFPQTIIGVVMCYGTNADYRNALREVCGKHGVPLLDIYSDDLPLFYGKESASSSVTNDQIAANKGYVLLSDNIHPSYDGHQRLADMYSGWLNTL